MTDIPHGYVKEADPVCGRPIDPTHAAFRVSYETEDYFFCSQACMLRFKEDPDRFTEEADSHEHP